MSVRRLLGVDVGGSSIKFGALELDLPDSGDPPRLLGTDTLTGHNRGSFDAAMDRLADALRGLVSRVGWEEPDSVGLGVPGLVARDTGVLHEAPNLHVWDGRAPGEELHRRLGHPVALDNDANAFALAEWRWGAGRGARNAVFLTVGTGIGCGLVVENHLVRGGSGFAGEPGHIRILPRDLRLGPGTSEEAEGYAGTEAIVARATAHPDRASDPVLQDRDPLTPEILHDAAERGSRVAADVWEDVGRGLGELLVTLVNVLNPERIVIGGGIGQAGRWLLDPARDYLSRHSLVARHSPPGIVVAALGPEAGLLGAAALPLETGKPGA
jgi:glucokinase